MPISYANPAFKVTYAEWRTVLDALRFYAKHLEAIGPAIREEDEDKWRLIYEDQERLDLIIPSLERQFKDYTDQLVETLHSSASAPKEVVTNAR